MKIINFEEISNLHITSEECFQWVNEMILHKNEAMLPPKTHMNMPGNIFCNVMPSIIRKENGSFGGVKIVTRYPERKPALDSKILLFNADNGRILALMDGNWITAMRTGAVAVHSIVNFAKKNFSVIGMIGLGNTARSTLIILAAMFPERQFQIKLLHYKDQAELFINRFRTFSNLHFSIIENVQDVVRNSDIVISCATYFEKDICPDCCFSEGVLVVPVHTRGFSNCDLFFDKIYADDTGHVDHFKNFSRFKYFAETCDVVNKRATGRENDKERILAYNIGISIHDINYAYHIYQKIEQNPSLFSSLPSVNMHDPEEKFWI